MRTIQFKALLLGLFLLGSWRGSALAQTTVQLFPWNTPWIYVTNGTDPGLNWMRVNYTPGSAWLGPSPGPLGYDSAALNPALGSNWGWASPYPPHLGYFFRSGFNYDGEPLDVELSLTTLIDDGAVFYLNGNEVLRVGMLETGAIRYNTAANRTVFDAVQETFVIPSTCLVRGTNVVAASAHNLNSINSDLVMGLRIRANYLPATPIVITNQPKDLVIEELKPVVFTVGIMGNTPRFQWFKDGVPLVDGGNIAGATRPTLIIDPTRVTNAGVYSVTISNVLGAFRSTDARLMVIPDTNAPILLSADGTGNLTEVLVSYSERVNPADATGTGNYVISNVTAGGTLDISRAVLMDETNVMLTTAARTLENNYLLFARDIHDLAPLPHTIPTNSAVPISFLLKVIEFSASWDYYDPYYDPFEPPRPPCGDPPSCSGPADAWTKESFTPNPQYWYAGPGAFVYAISYLSSDLPFPVGTNLNQALLPSYFRHRFNFDASPAGALLRLRHAVDDGGVFYLNGQELFRFNMPAGSIATNTPSAAAVGIPSITETNIPAAVLRLGQNLLAVETHQFTAARDDNVFGLELLAEVESLATGKVIITGGPSSQTVPENVPVTFGYQGVGGARFQWFKGTTPITDATNATYTIDPATLSLSGSTYKVRVYNDTSNAESTNATLTVVVDTNAPALVSAYGRAQEVTVTFTEPICATSATTTANYTITNRLGQLRSVSSARQTNGNIVVLTTATGAEIGDVLVVNNITDSSSNTNKIAPNSAVTIGFDPVLLALGGEWKSAPGNYAKTVTPALDLGTAWRDFTYDDTGWSNGLALLGVEDGFLPEPLRSPLVLANGKITYYFRGRFNYPGDPPTAGAFKLSYLIDDGAVFHLNGAEIHRIGVSTNQTFYTNASRIVGDAVLEGPFELPLPSLRQGENVLAVEVHQSSTSSADIVMGAQLSMPPVPSVPIPPEDVPDLVIRWEQPTGTVIISWTNQPDLILEQSSSATSGSWMPVSNQTNPYQLTPTWGGKLFFRLKRG